MKQNLHHFDDFYGGHHCYCSFLNSNNFLPMNLSTTCLLGVEIDIIIKAGVLLLPLACMIKGYEKCNMNVEITQFDEVVQNNGMSKIA